ncbi:MAG TPA: enoyl-CoA hydratase/isomerase family protein [Dehalococcoidia bacterium]|nr:enoyl-CoA hydratase/isomerase family protein [Dehalococcoidia bacterium]
MTTPSRLNITRDGTTMIVAFDNLPRHTLTAHMVTELRAIVDKLAADEETRVLVLTGAAQGTFITHYDVGELAVTSDAAREHQNIGSGAELHGMHQLLLALQALPQPVIAAVNGTAMGGGCELALACDFRIMARTGVIGLPEVRVGILPGAGGTQRMTRLLGTAKALELMLLGNTLDADAAERAGLVHRAVAPEQLMPRALALAHELAARPRLSLALIKQCILQGSEMPLEAALHVEQQAFWQTMRSEDASRLMRQYLQSDRPLDQQ